MGRRQSGRWGVVALGCVGVIAIGWATARRMGQVQVRTVEGTIVQIDASAREATLDIIHPKTGQPLKIMGLVPDDCDIKIDGVEANLDDLRVGERAQVNGTISRSLRIAANWVRVSRQPATQPATTPPATTQPATTQPVGEP